jgi:hypothetical protein
MTRAAAAVAAAGNPSDVMNNIRRLILDPVFMGRS